MTEWDLHTAKTQFSALFNAALAGEPQRVTHWGKRSVVVLSAEEYEHLCRLENANPPTFSDLLLQIPQDDQEFERLSLPPRPFGPCHPEAPRGI